MCDFVSKTAYFLKVSKHKRLMLALALSAIISVIFSYSLSIHIKFIISAFFMLLLSHTSRLALWAMTIVFSLIALIFPVTLNFGIPSRAHLLNAAHTTFREAFEFVLMVLTVKSSIILAVSLFLLALYLANGLKILQTKQEFLKKKYYKYISSSAMALIIFLSYKCYPPKIFVDACKNFQQIKQENSSFENNLKNPTDIVITKNSKKFKNVAVIIGESLTSDYLQVMGYPHETTPKLNKMNGHFYKNFISAAPYTNHSVYRTLNHCPDKQNYQMNNNLVSLANQAGFATYFFAAEPGDDINMSYSALSKYHAGNLPKSFEPGKISLTNPYRDDMPLLNYVRLSLSDNEESRMIFLHMMGHHPRVCKRLRGYPNYFKNLKHENMEGGQELNCYLSVTKKLDDFIADIDSQLKELNEPYAIFYFSDHGVVFDMDSKGGAFIHHGADYKSNYRVPYMVISSDIKEHKVFEGYASGYDMLPNILYYLGIDTNIIRAKSFPEISAGNPNAIVVFDGDKLLPYMSLKDSKVYY